MNDDASEVLGRSCIVSRGGSFRVVVVLLAIAAIGCGSVVVENPVASSDSTSDSTGSGGTSAGTGTASVGVGSAAGGAGGTGSAADCTAPKVTVVASKQWHPATIALDAGNVYWGNAGAPGESPPTAHV